MAVEQLEYFAPTLRRIEKQLLFIGKRLTLHIVVTLRQKNKEKLEILPIEKRSYTNQDGLETESVSINSREFLVLRIREWNAVNERYQNQDFFFSPGMVYRFKNALRRSLDWLDDERYFFYSGKYDRWMKDRKVADCSVQFKVISDKLVSVYPDLDDNDEPCIYIQFSSGSYSSCSREEAEGVLDFLNTFNVTQCAVSLLTLLRNSEKKTYSDPWAKYNNRLSMNPFLLDAAFVVMTPEKFTTLQEDLSIDLGDFVQKDYAAGMEAFRAWLLTSEEDDYDTDRKKIYAYLTKSSG